MPNQQPQKPITTEKKQDPQHKQNQNQNEKDKKNQNQPARPDKAKLGK